MGGGLSSAHSLIEGGSRRHSWSGLNQHRDAKGHLRQGGAGGSGADSLTEGGSRRNSRSWLNQQRRHILRLEAPRQNDTCVVAQASCRRSALGRRVVGD